MILAEFRAQVEAALADVVLGVYTLPNGESTPAVYVGDPPEGTTVSGLEVMIYPTPKPRIVNTFGGNLNIKSWQVRVINHPYPPGVPVPEGGNDLDAAIDAITDAFPGMPTPQLIEEAGDIAEQVLLTVPDDPE